jgi:hypothetical protein
MSGVMKATDNLFVLLGWFGIENGSDELSLAGVKGHTDTHRHHTLGSQLHHLDQNIRQIKRDKSIKNET